MKLLSIVASTLALGGTAVAAPAALLSSPLDTLVNGVLASNAAVNKTVAAYRVGKISADQARACVDGNSSAVKRLATTSNSTVNNLLTVPASLTYTPAGLQIRLQNAVATMKNDIKGTYAPPQALDESPIQEFFFFLYQLGLVVIGEAILVPALLGAVAIDTALFLLKDIAMGQFPDLLPSIKGTIIGLLGGDESANRTFAACRDHTISANTAQTYLQGNATMMSGLVTTFNNTATSIFAAPSSSGSGVSPTAFNSQLASNMMKLKDDFIATYTSQSLDSMSPIEFFENVVALTFDILVDLSVIPLLILIVLTGGKLAPGDTAALPF